MSHVTAAVLGLLLVVSTTIAADEQTPAEQYEALVEAYEQDAQPREFAGRFLQLAEAHPRSPAAVDALAWVLSELPRRKEGVRALALLTKDHMKSRAIEAACLAIANTASSRAETLLRALLAKSTHLDVRAEACWHLSSLLEQQAILVEQLKKHPEMTDRVTRYYGKEYGPYLVALEAGKVAERRAELYEQIIKSFRDIKTEEGTMGEVAEAALFKLRHLSIGRVAPEIEGEDIFGKKFKLSDYRGKVVVLSFWGHW